MLIRSVDMDVRGARVSSRVAMRLSHHASTRSPMTTRNYWIGVVSKAHVEAAVAGGFTQLNYGKADALERMRQGDGFAFYSPRTKHQDGDRVQAFTAIGRL